MQLFVRVLSAYRAALAQGGTFLPLYLLLQLLAAGISAPLIGAAVKVSLTLSDQTALTDQDIAFFLLSPLGTLAGLISVSLFAAAEVFTFSVMASAVAAGAGSGWSAALHAVLRTGARLRALVHFTALFLLRLSAWVLPFALAGLLAARMLLWDYDINYYLTQRPPEFLLAAALGIVLGTALAAVLLLRLSAWAVSLHLVLFEGCRPAAAFGESARRMAGQRGALKLELLAWGMVRFAAGAVLAFFAGLAVALIPSGAEVPVARVLLLGLLAVLLLVSGNMALSALSLAALAIVLQRHWGGKVGPAAEPEHRHAPTAGLFAGSVAVAVAGLWAGSALWGDLQTRDDVEIIAHRGAAGSAPENTLAAVKEALEQGADWIEIDVQETEDGQIAVVHDADLMKLAGVPLQVHAVSFDRLAAEDIGSWFDPAFAQERVPLLRDVLALTQGRAGLLIEFKHYGHAQALEERVIAEVEAFGMADQVALMSLKYPSVQKAIALRPDWRSGVLAASAVGDLTGLDGDFLAVRAAMAQPGLVRALHGAGKDIYVWTVNDPLAMSRMISKGVDGLITDEPGLARQVLEARAGLSTPERMVLWLVEELDLDKKRFRDDSP